jgi:hypothetical protein
LKLLIWFYCSIWACSRVARAWLLFLCTELQKRKCWLPVSFLRIAEPAAFTHLCKTVDFACIYKIDKIGTEIIGNQISFFSWIFLLLSTQKPFSCCSPHKNLFIPKKCTHKRSMLRPYDDTWIWY